MSALSYRSLLLPALLFGGGIAFGHGNHEILLENWDGDLIPGHVHGNQYQHRVRVWSAAFGGDFGIEDGYHAFPAGTAIRVDVLDAVRAWDGFDFDALANGRVTVSSGAGSVTSGDGPVRGFTSIVPREGIHWHLDFAFSGEVAAGPHLLELAFDAVLPSGEHVSSDPIWIVFDGGIVADAYDAALRYVEDALAAEMHFDSIAVEPGAPGTIAIHGATPGARVHLLASRMLGSDARGGLAFDLAQPIVIGTADAAGDEAQFTLNLPPELLGQELHFQAVELATGRTSAWASVRL